MGIYDYILLFWRPFLSFSRTHVSTGADINWLWHLSTRTRPMIMVFDQSSSLCQYLLWHRTSTDINGLHIKSWVFGENRPTMIFCCQLGYKASKLHKPARVHVKSPHGCISSRFKDPTKWKIWHLCDLISLFSAGILLIFPYSSGWHSTVLFKAIFGERAFE